MTSPTLPEDPLFVERVPGVGLINALLITYDIKPVFAHKVVARKKHAGAYSLDGYFEKYHKADIELYQIHRIIEEFAPKDENRENTPRVH